MNKKSCMALATLIAGTISMSAQAAFTGFTGLFAPNQWTTTVSGNLTGAAGGSSDINAMRLVLTGGNDFSPDPVGQTAAYTGATAGVPGPCEIRFVTTNIANPFIFDWSYLSRDSAGAGNDLFGVVINDVETQLSDPGGAIAQSGHLLVAANHSFGWYVDCTDCIEGAAAATITNFQAAVVPEPGVIALPGMGIVAAGFARSRKSTRIAA